MCLSCIEPILVILSDTGARRSGCLDINWRIIAQKDQVCRIIKQIDLRYNPIRIFNFRKFGSVANRPEKVQSYTYIEISLASTLIANLVTIIETGMCEKCQRFFALS